jgi:hypothetical protein
VPALDGVTEDEGPKVELFPVILGVLAVPAVPPPLVPVHEAFGEATSHHVKETAPVGARPMMFPATVAESVQVLPTVFEDGAVIEVVKPGVACSTLKHSVSLCWPTET